MKGMGMSVVVCLGLASAASGQIPNEFTNLQVLPEETSRAELLGVMRGFSLGTGLRCQHCHVAEDPSDFSTFDFASDDRREKRVARAMLRMVMTLNGTILPQIADRAAPSIEVACVTCHAGKRRPTTLQQELRWAHEAGGGDALRARYAELRERYFGFGAYDFGPRSLEAVGEPLVRVDPRTALEVAELNLEYHPERAPSWNLKGAALAALGRADEAIVAFERSLVLAPDNPPALRALERLRGGG